MQMHEKWVKLILLCDKGKKTFRANTFNDERSKSLSVFYFEKF